MEHPQCDVEVGTHVAPFWVDADAGLAVCERHRRQYEEDGRFGPFKWQRVAEANPEVKESPKNRSMDFSAFIDED